MAKKVSKAKAKAAAAAVLGAPAARRAAVGSKGLPALSDVWGAKCAISGMSLRELDEFEATRRDMLRHGQGILAAVAARRAELAE